MLFALITVGGEEGQPPGLAVVDSSRRRMPGPILNSTSFSKQKNPVNNDSAVTKDVTVSLGSAWLPPRLSSSGI